MSLLPFRVCMGVLVLTMFVWLLSPMTQGHAQAKPELNIVTIPLPPWGYKARSNDPAGICYEWSNAIAERMGRNYSNTIQPMARLFKEIEFGKADFAIMLKTPYSEKISVPVANVNIPFKTVVWPRKGLKIKSYKDLQGLQISMARGLKVGGDFAKQKNLNIQLSNDYAHSMQMFAAKRVDAVVGTLQSLTYNAYRQGLDARAEFGDPFVVAELEGWVQASRRFIAREGIEELREAAESLIADGTFQRIFNKHHASMPYISP